eukprot:157300-Hanusia_phi.AAC.2
MKLVLSAAQLSDKISIPGELTEASRGKAPRRDCEMLPPAYGIPSVFDREQELSPRHSFLLELEDGSKVEVSKCTVSFNQVAPSSSSDWI